MGEKQMNLSNNHVKNLVAWLRDQTVNELQGKIDAVLSIVGTKENDDRRHIAGCARFSGAADGDCVLCRIREVIE